MAIKGKKKQQRRSAGRRRPAAMPRAYAPTPSKPAWYKTTRGQSIAAVSTLLVLVFGLWAVAVWRSNAREADQRREALETYSDGIRGVLQNTAPIASEMTTAIATPADELDATATGWKDGLVEVQAELTALLPPEGAEDIHQLFTQSVQLLTGAADSFDLAPKVGANQQQNLVGQASRQVSSANAVWEAAVGLLEDARDEAGLGAAGLRGLTTPQPGAQPTAPGSEVSIPPVPAGGGEDEPGKKKKGGKSDD